MNEKRNDRERLVFDARGNPRWEDRIAPGEYQPRSQKSSALDALKADELQLAETRRVRALNNPYGNNSAVPKSLRSRSGLDYLRALSESIKAKRRAMPDKAD